MKQNLLETIDHEWADWDILFVDRCDSLFIQYGLL
ncbi:hypothetical protein J2T15_004490 [Paenibacillus harenae]|uniref:Uncharacterized protein n=1 Tax=Paenibacillus harenae TaxID=306543 RepID=A0ABT9U5X6_PAEHA|nr:hypothetical protein [Paenibacillus harenae]MDQ0115033.1 hypothetical protein [Paenibacillus harenae]